MCPLDATPALVGPMRAWRRLKRMVGQSCFETEAMAAKVRATIIAGGFEASPVRQAGNGWWTFSANADCRWSKALQRELAK